MENELGAGNKKPEILEIENPAYTIRVSNKDIDTNRHLNNEKGAELLMDALPFDFFFTDMSIIYKNQPEYLKSADGDNTKRGKIIKVFESLSPYEFLKAKNKGTKPSDRDMQLLETLLIDMQLKPAVVNVLIDYTLKTNNNKLCPIIHAHALTNPKLKICVQINVPKILTPHIPIIL